MDGVIILIIFSIVSLIILAKLSQKKHEKFAPISAVTEWKYPEEAVKLSEENVDFVMWSPDGVTPFLGHQNPIGAEIWYARTPMDAIESVPLSTTLVSPYCCPSEYSTPSGCFCNGNAGRILHNIKMNTL